MIGYLKNKEIDSWFLRGFIIFVLLFPVFYSPHTDVYQSAYYGGFSGAYFMLMLYMSAKILQTGFAEWKKWIPYLGMLLIYNLLSFYFNYKYLHWYWEQINNTVAFLTFAVLGCYNVKLDEGKRDNIRFLICCIVISNAASIIYYLLGYTGLLICNNQVIRFELPTNFFETRHYWIYSHKSEYAFMLVAFVALFVAFREKFKNRYTYAASLAVLLICLYLTHSWTGIVGVLLIFMGSVLDRIEWKKFLRNKKFWGIAGIIVALLSGVGYMILKERDISTLGSRTLIWAESLKVISKYPEGWGLRFGQSAVGVIYGGYFFNNAHNVFLNHLLRFSVPVGICFTVHFLGIVIYSLIKAKSFLAVGMWMALLMLMTMDYSLMSLQMALLFLIVYLVCFCRGRVNDEDVE